MRPDVAVYLAIPKQYNSHQYSEGCRETWKIEFRGINEIRGALNQVGMLEIDESIKNFFKISVR